MAFFKNLLSFFKRGDSNFRELEKSIGYTFKNRQYLKHALTHRSHAFSESNDKLLSNERLEFLGDALLGFTVSEYLYSHYKNKLEGELSSIKSLVISRKALKEAADKISLGKYILLSHSEEKTGGRKRFSIISNTFESLIAGIYLDGGYSPAEKFIHNHLLSLLDSLLKNSELINYKSKLLEVVQAKGEDAPHYLVVNEIGPDHKKIFEIAVSFWGEVYGKGKGQSKKAAEQLAAKKALSKLKTPEEN